MYDDVDHGSIIEPYNVDETRELRSFPPNFPMSGPPIHPQIPARLI